MSRLVQNSNISHKKLSNGRSRFFTAHAVQVGRKHEPRRPRRPPAKENHREAPPHTDGVRGVLGPALTTRWNTLRSASSMRCWWECARCSRWGNNWCFLETHTPASPRISAFPALLSRHPREMDARVHRTLEHKCLPPQYLCACRLQESCTQPTAHQHVNKHILVST